MTTINADIIKYVEKHYTVDPSKLLKAMNRLGHYTWEVKCAVWDLARRGKVRLNDYDYRDGENFTISFSEEDSFRL